MDTFEHKGLTFRIDIEPDQDHGAPWEERDGHGPVSGWRDRESKAPGERVLCVDRGKARFYDYAGAMKLAKRDGWGLADDERAKLKAGLGREPTDGEVREQAVDRDFKCLSDWCNDQWHYVVVFTTLLDTDGNKTTEVESCGGVESFGDWYKEIAKDGAAEIAARIGRKKTLTVTRPARVTKYRVRA
jgi:hypothetical protein